MVEHLTREQLVEGCERQMGDARRLAGQILAPVQIVALEGAGLRIVPEWMIATLLRVVGRASDTETEFTSDAAKEKT